MVLKDLLKFNDIVIQCHDNPDADAIASGYALWWYLKGEGKDPTFIYRGYNQIKKSNLMIMIDGLDIPIQYEPDFDRIPELVIYVDCQAGQRNVTFTEGQTIAVIDHHMISGELPSMSNVRSNIGSCSTVVWEMIRKIGIDVNDDKKIATALYYGLYTDTNSLSEMSHPLDRDMVDYLKANKSFILTMRNSNISLEELKITGQALFNYDYHLDSRYVVIMAEQCDPNILGVISDFALETDGVDICVAYAMNPSEVKLSVRSCIKEVHANELAADLTRGIGGGGGHLTKAGGSIKHDLFENVYGDYIKDDSKQALSEAVHKALCERMDTYFSSYEIIYAQTAEIDTTGMKMYQKLPQQVGFVKATDVFPAKSMVEIRTLEGDVTIRVEEDSYIMIGIEGEVYPIKKAKLESSYTVTDEPYDREFEYSPNVKNTETGEVKNLMSLAKMCISTATARIYSKPLDRNVKLFTLWDEEKYYSGKVGDYIAVRPDDSHDIYIIQERLFDLLYAEVED